MFHIFEIITDVCAINGPFGQTHSPNSSDHCSRLKIVLFCENLKVGRTTHAKILITTGRDCGSAEWIKIETGLQVPVLQ